MSESNPAAQSDPHSTPEAAARLRRARFADRTARRVIIAGGIAVLVSVLAIFFFIGREAAPLLSAARLAPAGSWKAPARPLAITVDEYRAVAAVALEDGSLLLADAATGAEKARVRLAPDGIRATAAAAAPGPVPVVAAVTARGALHLARIESRVTFDAKNARSVAGSAEVFDAVEAHDGPLDLVAVRVFDEDKCVAVVSGPGKLAVVRAKLGGRSRVTDLPGHDLRAARVRSLAVTEISEALRVYAGLEDGRVLRWNLEWNEDPALHESVEASKAPVTALTVLLGGETLVTAAEDGRVSTWFGVRATAESAGWNLTRIRTMEPLGSAARVAAPTARGKGWVSLGADGRGRIDYATTGATLAELPSIADPAAAVFAPKNDGLYVADASGTVHVFDFDAPHPEATLSALFGDLWYEGGTAPEKRWQSTGGADDFEAKLSLSVLVFGTLKGVLYALLVSVPIALFAAVYTALYLPANVKAVVKPVIEVMAALPSVVVGLVAALWLSPLVERNLPAVFCGVPAFVVAFAVLVVGWTLLPRALRTRWMAGTGVLGPSSVAVLLAFGIAAAAGPHVEDALFGGDVKAWIFRTTGLHFDPRNALVVGFAMGFAVIPVIFTIAEDAIANVPKSLWAASEALGASRWQTTTRVVLPAATPGIFAALMLGFGRAVGETMIVLMATGNTPILEMSPFNGMRTISACIAVEIPEAPHGGTLYRVLFLAGVLLFTFTFCCNTVAEVVGSRLRKRYGRAG